MYVLYLVRIGNEPVIYGLFFMHFGVVYNKIYMDGMMYFIYLIP